MILAIDTETTGLDYFHGCKPFAVSTCDDAGHITYYEWDVDPLTREVQIIPKEISKLQKQIEKADLLIFHNAKFDVRGLSTIGIQIDWDKVEDTLIMSHCLRNQWKHGLKFLANVCLYIDDADEEELGECVKWCRRLTRKTVFREQYGTWRIAKEGDPHFPGQTDTKEGKNWWRDDLWLPRAINRGTELLFDKDFKTAQKICSREKTTQLETVCKRYAIRDVERTMGLYWWLLDGLQSEDLVDQYEQRRQLLRVTYDMENHGVNVLPSLSSETDRYGAMSNEYESTCRSQLNGRFSDLNLNSSQQLQKVLFGHFKLPRLKKTPGGKGSSTDAETLKNLSEICESQNYNNAGIFVNSLIRMKRAEKAQSYLESYQKWTVDHSTMALTRHKDGQFRRYKSRIHSLINITGTRFTRQSMNDPNLQNVGTGKEEDGDIEYNLRTVFGPEKGRQWLDVDYSNLELRIWAYSCGNKELIEGFEQGESIHLIIACELFPQLRRLSDEDAKNTIDYKHTKNGNFAIIYGASPYKADQTYGVNGAYSTLSRRFPETRVFTDKLRKLVDKQGYVTTRDGYRLYVPLSDPHKAVSAYVQGTAGDVIGGAMRDCYDFLLQNPRQKTNLILQIHDELVFDQPLNSPDRLNTALTKRMEQQGKRIGIPTPVEGQIVKDNWSKGEKI